MLKQLYVRWVAGGISTGVFLTILGFWDWGVALFTFCLAAAYGQFRLDRSTLRHRAESVVR